MPQYKIRNVYASSSPQRTNQTVMNQTLSLRRFQKVLRLHFAEYRKSYLLSLGLCIGGMILLMSPILLTQQYNDALYIVHISALFGILFGSSLFTSTAFNAYSNASQGITAIMLPASQAEKFLVILLTNLLFVLLTLFVAHPTSSWLSGRKSDCS